MDTITTTGARIREALTVADAKAQAARLHLLDQVVPFAPIFFNAPCGLIAIMQDGTAYEAEIVRGEPVVRLLP